MPLDPASSFAKSLATSVSKSLATHPFGIASKSPGRLSKHTQAGKGVALERHANING
jgi:hypothetical protein